MWTSNAQLAQLAEARVRAGAQLEAAIEALGHAYADYQRATQALEFKTNVDLGRYLDAGITMHLAQAGLSAFLERKLAGVAPPLSTLIEQQHHRTSIAALRP